MKRWVPSLPLSIALSRMPMRSLQKVIVGEVNWVAMFFVAVFAFSRPRRIERWASTSPGLTAHRAVNAVPYVCEAAPGIRTSVDLPQIIADLSGANTG